MPYGIGRLGNVLFQAGSWSTTYNAQGRIQQPCHCQHQQPHREHHQSGPQLQLRQRGKHDHPGRR
jgi:hypothetical protein